MASLHLACAKDVVGPGSRQLEAVSRAPQILNTRVREGSLRAREALQRRLREIQTEHRAPDA